MIRTAWHYTPDQVTPLPGGLQTNAWLVTVGRERFVAKRARAGDHCQFEAGLAAAAYLRTRGVAVGVPVRTADGRLCALTDAGALALLRALPGRPLDAPDPLDQQWWGDHLGRVHRMGDGFTHPGVTPWHWLRPDAGHLAVEPWLRPAVTAAVAALTKLCVTDRLTYGLLHGDPVARAFVLDVDTGRTGLTEWGAAAAGPLTYDVAAAVLYAGGPRNAGELLDGYASAGPVPREELDAALPVMLRFRWAVQADWHARHLDAGIDTAPHRDGLRRAREALAVV